ncbi:hypothetical protein HK105_209208 [Polyrhizophydium stewartii]|uniref:Chitin-binding type-4 domain-containing protein n=1 Tax=Polyrhizophydium stewartii TaxID=2732419 RepID=A0ABR4MVN8_9FUNG|nr:hypothetical protein HK105_001391 [Polyrhizophydium stewartii]
MHAAAAALALAFACAPAAAHGMLVHPGPLAAARSAPAVRSYALIDHEIDSLRSPLAGASLCRGAPRGAVTPITLANGSPFTVTMAFSIGAQHIGPCAVEILDANDRTGASAVTITSVAGPRGCAVAPIAAFETDKLSPAASQCPGRLPPKLVTNDMCMFEWTFTVTNADKIKCTDCVLRWTWAGEHISTTNPEKYENCADVRVTVVGGSQSSGSNAAGSTTPTRPRRGSATTKSKAAAPTRAVTKTRPSQATTTTAASRPASAACDACRKSSGAPRQMACTSDATGFYACFADQPSREPVRMACAAGTSCVQAGDYIHCQ